MKGTMTTPAIYYVLKTDETDEQGPFTEEELREQIASGKLANEDRVTVPGADEWEPVAKWMDRKSAVREALATSSEIRKQEEPSNDNAEALRWIGGVCIFILLGVVVTKSLPSSEWYDQRKALKTAKEYVDERFVVDRISDKSEVHKTGMGEYEVQLTVDRRNAMGGPMRNKIKVSVEAYGGWHVVDLQEEQKLE